MKFVFLALLILAFQNCSHHDEVPSVIEGTGGGSGGITSPLSREQKSIMSKNAHFIAGHDMIFYANKYLLPAGVSYLFGFHFDPMDACGVISKKESSIVIRCKQPGQLRVILYTTDPLTFAVTQKEEVIEVMDASELSVALTEAALFPEGREIPDTSSPPVFDDEEPQGPNGALLYAENCFSCHGNIAQSTVNNRSLSAFKSALQAVPQMISSSFLQELSDEEIQAIMDAF